MKYGRAESLVATMQINSMRPKSNKAIFAVISEPNSTAIIRGINKYAEGSSSRKCVMLFLESIAGVKAFDILINIIDSLQKVGEWRTKETTLVCW